MVDASLSSAETPTRCGPMMLLMLSVRLCRHNEPCRHRVTPALRVHRLRAPRWNGCSSTIPDSNNTSTSTVGLPLESSFSSVIFSIFIIQTMIDLISFYVAKDTFLQGVPSTHKWVFIAAPLPLLGSFVSKNNFEYKMFVLQHFLPVFLLSENLQRVLEHFTKNTRKLSRLVLQIALTKQSIARATSIARAIRNVPRAMEAIAPSSWVDCPSNFLP